MNLKIFENQFLPQWNFEIGPIIIRDGSLITHQWIFLDGETTKAHTSIIPVYTENRYHRWNCNILVTKGGFSFI